VQTSDFVKAFSSQAHLGLHRQRDELAVLGCDQGLPDRGSLAAMNERGAAEDGRAGWSGGDEIGPALDRLPINEYNSICYRPIGSAIRSFPPAGPAIARRTRSIRRMGSHNKYSDYRKLFGALSHEDVARSRRGHRHQFAIFGCAFANAEAQPQGMKQSSSSCVKTTLPPQQLFVRNR
jgi:hypothetical protein